MDKPETFRFNDVKVLGRETGYKGFFKLVKVQLQHRLFKGGWSAPFERELFTKGPAACALLYDPQKDLIGLVEQFRVGALQSAQGPWTLECVAGLVEDGETPEVMARRELQEEAGITDAELIYITEYYPTPGSCDEYVYLYCALCELGDAEGDFGLAGESEDIRLHVYPAQEVFGAMLKGRTNNAATLLGLQWLQLNRESLRAGVKKPYL